MYNCWWLAISELIWSRWGDELVQARNSFMDASRLRDHYQQAPNPRTAPHVDQMSLQPQLRATDYDGHKTLQLRRTKSPQ